ncbi:MAG: flagellin, partial [Parvibaculum sp.]
DITGKNFTAAGDLAILAADFSTDTKINSAIIALNAATTTLRKQASTFGANLSVVQNRQDFTKALINVLQTGAGNLTLADSNEESANLLALQTRQSISTQTLSLANQAEQNVLSLIR